MDENKTRETDVIHNAPQHIHSLYKDNNIILHKNLFFRRNTTIFDIRNYYDIYNLSS